MSQDEASLIIGVATLALSWGGSLFISGFRSGSAMTRLATLEALIPNLASKEQLAGVKEDIAEIKGMFRMTLRDGSDGR